MFSGNEATSLASSGVGETIFCSIFSPISTTSSSSIFFSSIGSSTISSIIGFTSSTGFGSSTTGSCILTTSVSTFSSFALDKSILTGLSCLNFLGVVFLILNSPSCLTCSDMI